MNTLSSFLAEYSSESIKIIDPTIHSRLYIPIHLSESNTDLKHFDTSSSQAWTLYINAFLEKNQAKVAFGGYLEKRGIYDRSDYFNSKNEASQRNIHLGIDLWCNEGTSVLAAFDGEVHSFKNNTNYGDYGPTIVLKHCFNNIQFFTLYGHLSLDALSNFSIGQKIEQGQVIAYLGGAHVNGDYAPHLHFQIIKDIQAYSGDYPGVCSQNELEVFKENCPDPNLVLKLY